MTLKREFIVFDPLSVRIRWDRPLQIQDYKLDDHDSINIVDASTELESSVPASPKESRPLNKFSVAGQEAIAQAKKDGHLVEFAGKLPSPIERKKLLANGVIAKNSDTWAKFVYREAFGIKDKDLGIGWREFAQKIQKPSFEAVPDKSSQSLRYQELLNSRPLDEKKYIEGCKILTWLLSNSHINQKIYQVGIKELGLPH